MADTIGVGSCLIIDDSVDVSHPDLNAGLRGMKPRDWARFGYGAVAGTAPFPAELIIQPDEYEDRVKKQEADQSSLEHIADAMGVPVKNQQQTNFCWVNAPTHCVELLRAKQGQPYVELSPASVGAVITDFSNIGGYGPEAVAKIASDGLVSASLWPVNAINKEYDTAAANSERPKYQLDAWWDLKPRTMLEVFSCLLRNIPVAVGLNWWGHEVTYIRVVKSNGIFVPKFDNSWGTSWGDNGRGILTGSKMIPDDCIAPRLATAA